MTKLLPQNAKKDKKKIDAFQPMVDKALREQRQRIKILLLQQGLKETDLARELGTTPQMICNVIQGRKNAPRYEEGIAKILGAPVDRIFKRRQVIKTIERILR